MIILSKDQQRRLASVARRAYPREACGLLFAPPGPDTRLTLIPTTPRWNTSRSFRIRGHEIERLRGEREAMGDELVGCFHSHLLSGPEPSPSDAEGAQRPGELWLIYSVRLERTALYRWDGAAFERQPLHFP